MCAMLKTKTFISSFLLGVVLTASPAYAVVDIVKLLQHTLRNVQEIIEVVQNESSLKESTNYSKLQGEIGAIMPKVIDLGSKVKDASFTPVLPSEIQGLLGDKGMAAVPQLRSFLSKDLKSINVGDVVGQRDALAAISEQMNLGGIEAFKNGKEAMALLNKAPNELMQQLSVATGAKDMQNKITQETGNSIQILKSDIAINQHLARKIETLAQSLRLDVKKGLQEAGKQLTENTGGQQ